MTKEELYYSKQVKDFCLIATTYKDKHSKKVETRYNVEFQLEDNSRQSFWVTKEQYDELLKELEK